MKKNTTKATKPAEFSRPIEKYFQQLNDVFGESNKGLFALLLAFSFFAVMGLIWMIPFPQFDFLIKLKMHTFLNWGSFFIAIVIYIYLKLAPTLSYAMLFSISAMSFFIVRLEYVERDGGPTVVLVCSILAILSLSALYVLSRKQKNMQITDFIRLLTIGPLWLWSKVFDRFKWKY